MVTTLREQLDAALRAHDLSRSEALVRLWLTNGAGFPALCDQLLVPALRRTLASRDELAARQAIMLSLALVSRLRRPGEGMARGSAVFAVPSLTPAFVETYMLAAALEQQGWRVTLLGDLHAEDLLRLDGRPDVLVVGDHGPLRNYLRAVRQRWPETVLVAIADVPEADLVLSGIGDTVVAVNRRVVGASDTDLEILARVAQGRTNKEIARDLGLTPSTVKSRLDRLFARLGVPDRASAAAAALRQGWID